MGAADVVIRNSQGEIFHPSVYEDEATFEKDVVSLADHSLRYRTYRGEDVPVYDRPRSLGLLNKVRGEARWTGWLFTPTRFIADMLPLLTHGPDLFVALHERRSGRTRWIHGLSLQTNDPAEE